MNSISYTISHSVQSRTLKIGVLYGKMVSLIRYQQLFKRVLGYISLKNGLAAVTIDKQIPQRITPFQVLKSQELVSLVGEDAYAHYLTFEKGCQFGVPQNLEHINIQWFKQLHSFLCPNVRGDFRDEKRLLTKSITQNGILKDITFEVKTTPEQILPKLHDFLRWFHSYRKGGNPIVLAAISHVKLVEIHPFLDGNGRVARVFEQMALAANDVFQEPLIFTGVYFLENIERYYDLIESSLETRDYTQWIEFYSEAILASLIEVADVFKQLSFGAVDVENNIVVDLSDLESKVLQCIHIKNIKSSSEIAKKLGYSRQNIYRVIVELTKKGLLKG